MPGRLFLQIGPIFVNTCITHVFPRGSATQILIFSISQI